MYGYETLLDAYEREQERRYSNRPSCDCCGVIITDATALLVNRNWYCNECVDTYLRKDVADYAED